MGAVEAGGPGRDRPGSGGSGGGKGPGGGDPDGRLFVYGTLRSGADAPEPVAVLLDRAAERAGPARIRGRLFDAGGFPAAVPGGEGEVRGELLRLRRPGRTLAALDRYEGSVGEDPLFRREAVPVRREEAGRTTAWVYAWARPVEGLTEIPSGDWLATAAPPGEPGDHGES